MLIAVGTAFDGGREVAVPSSVMDLLPAVLRLLGEDDGDLRSHSHAYALAHAFAEPTSKRKFSP